MAGLKHTAFRAGFSPMNVYDKMMHFGLGGMKKEVVRGQGQDLMKTLFLSFDDIDWSRTQAYSLGNVGQVCLNVAGREPQGCVQPGDEYEQLRDEIIARLYELRDPETGEQVVETGLSPRGDLQRRLSGTGARTSSSSRAGWSTSALASMSSAATRSSSPCGAASPAHTGSTASSWPTATRSSPASRSKART